MRKALESNQSQINDRNKLAVCPYHRQGLLSNKFFNALSSYVQLVSVKIFAV